MIGNEKGNHGELIAFSYLTKKGYNVIKTNYTTRYGEIDIIAEDDKHIIFVEVKLRKEKHIVSGFESVDFKKQNRIIKSSCVFLQKEPTDKQPRYDVISVLVKDGKNYLKHIKSAFTTEGVFE